MQKKIQKTFFRCEIIASELVTINTRFYWENILVIGCHYGKKESQDFRYFQKRGSRADFLSEWSKNIMKILPFWLQHCFGPFKMLTVHKCSDTVAFWAFTWLRFFQARILERNHLWSWTCFLKVFKILCRFWKCRKKLRKLFFVVR